MDSEIRELIAHSYTMNAESRNHKEIIDWKYSELQKFMNNFDSFSNARILDLGAGSGIYAKYFEGYGAEMKCIDISEGMVELCRAKNLDAEIMDFYELKFRDGEFRGIWSMNTLLHVPKASLSFVLEGIKRIMSSDGIFYMGLYGGTSSEGIYEDDFYEPKRFFARYADDEIKAIICEHFEILSFERVEFEGEDYWYQSFVLGK